jgi:hypothetical protein
MTVKTAGRGLLLLVIAALLSGCGPVEEGEAPRETLAVTMFITRGYGQEVMVDTVLPIEEGWTVYDALLQTADIDTGYGGGFVSAIEGLGTQNAGPDGRRRDWFYYVNGTAADVGALDYQLSDGDFVWWDYHPWSMTLRVNSAVTGMYPATFAKGYRGVPETLLIAHTGESAALARALEQAVTELSSAEVRLIELGELGEAGIADRNSPVILLGLWEALAEVPFVAGINDNHHRTGAFSYYQDGRLWLVDAEGTALDVGREAAGSLTAYGEGLGDCSPLWVITAVDDEGLVAAVDQLLTGGGSIRGSYSAAVVGEEVYKLPLKPGD